MGAARNVLAAGVVCTIALLGVRVPAARAQEAHASGGISMRVASGTFGGDVSTTIVYAPAVVRLDAHRFELAGFFPYVALKNRTGTLSDAGWIPMQGTVAGSPSMGMPASGGGMMGGGMMGGATGQPPTTTPGVPAPTALANPSGIGDLAFSAGYRVLDDLLTGTQVVVSTRVKIPTASITQGLGTGRTDVGAAATVRRRFDSGWLYGDLGYVVVGRPAGTDVQNAVTWGVGGGRRLASSVFLLASAFGNTAVIRGFGSPVEVGAGFGVRIADHLNVTAMPTVGLSKASPSYGLLVGLSTDLWRW